MINCYLYNGLLGLIHKNCFFQKCSDKCPKVLDSSYDKLVAVAASVGSDFALINSNVSISKTETPVYREFVV